MVSFEGSEQKRSFGNLSHPDTSQLYSNFDLQQLFINVNDVLYTGNSRTENDLQSAADQLKTGMKTKDRRLME